MLDWNSALYYNLFLFVFILGCGSLSLPSAIASYCSLDVSCLGVGCCLTLDLDIVQRSFSVWSKLDACASRFSFGFDEWSHSEMLNIATLQSKSCLVPIYTHRKATCLMYWVSLGWFQTCLIQFAVSSISVYSDKVTRQPVYVILKKIKWKEMAKNKHEHKRHK